MIRIAAHEDEEVADPVGDAESEDVLVEAHGGLDIGREERGMAELARHDAMERISRPGAGAGREQFDLQARSDR